MGRFRYSTDHPIQKNDSSKPELPILERSPLPDWLNNTTGHWGHDIGGHLLFPGSREWLAPSARFQSAPGGEARGERASIASLMMRRSFQSAYPAVCHRGRNSAPLPRRHCIQCFNPPPAVRPGRTVGSHVGKLIACRFPSPRPLTVSMRRSYAAARGAMPLDTTTNGRLIPELRGIANADRPDTTGPYRFDNVSHWQRTEEASPCVRQSSRASDALAFKNVLHHGGDGRTTRGFSARQD